MRLLLITLIMIFQSCGSLKQTNTERQEELLLKQEALTQIQTSDVNKYPDIYLAEESILQDIDKTEGIVYDSFYTGEDSARLSISINYSQDYEDPTKVQMIDLQYLSRLKNSYRGYWWGFQTKRATAKYSAIADEATGDLLTAERKDSTQTFTIIGLGVGHRFRALASAMLTDRFFENISIFGNYILHADSSSSEAYKGYGYTAEYGLNYRSNQKLFYGGKISYNWATVERAKQADESLAERSLAFGWLTLGFELGFYF